MKTKLLIFSLSFFLIQGCSPSDDEFIPTLPPISQTGANTFGCFIDGKLLVPRDGSGSTLGSDRGMRFFAFPPDRLYNEIVVRDFSSDEAGRIVLHILDLENLSAGEYVVNESNCQDNEDSPFTTNIFCRMFDTSQGSYKNYCSYENSGNISITKNDGTIVSGVFNVTVRNLSDDTDEIEIIDGRFDINRATLSEANFQ
jgi:hypothetical protein